VVEEGRLFKMVSLLLDAVKYHGFTAAVHDIVLF